MRKILTILVVTGFLFMSQYAFAGTISLSTDQNDYAAIEKGGKILFYGKLINTAPPPAPPPKGTSYDDLKNWPKVCDDFASKNIELDFYNKYQVSGDEDWGHAWNYWVEEETLITETCEDIGNCSFRCTADPQLVQKIRNTWDVHTSSYLKFMQHDSSSDSVFLFHEWLNNNLSNQVDRDNDSVPDIIDNCPDLANYEQTSLVQNFWGDKCLDADNDGVPADIDNCPVTVNPDQKDSDGDGTGDACQQPAAPPSQPPDVSMEFFGLLDIYTATPKKPDPSDFKAKFLPDPDVQKKNEDSKDADDTGDSDDTGDTQNTGGTAAKSEGDIGIGRVFDEGGACQLMPNAQINPTLFLILAAILLPLFYKREK